MKPEIIAHHTLSLDGAYQHETIDKTLHRQLAEQFEPDAYLLEAEDILAMLPDSIPMENETDKLERTIDDKDSRPYVIIMDDKGGLMDKIHMYRRKEYLKDLIILISEATPKSYRSYLRERHIPNICIGVSQIDVQNGLELVAQLHGIKKIVVESGPKVYNELFKNELIDELSLLLAPMIHFHTQRRLFDQTAYANFDQVMLVPRLVEMQENGYVWLRYTLNY